MKRWGWAVVIVVGAVTWAGTLGNAFQYDDVHSIVDNVHLREASQRGGSSWTAFFSDPSTFSVDAEKAMYRPLLVTTYALNFAVGRYLSRDGFDVSGYHVANIVIHLANATLVWWLVGLLGGGTAGRLFGALLFVAHPLCSEPVNYISSRSESLSALFYLLGLCLFLHAHRLKSHMVWRVGAWLALAAGLLTKSTVMTLLVAWLLVDGLVLARGDLRRVLRRLVSHHLPGWLIAGAYLLIVIDNGWLTRSLAQHVRGPWEQLLTQMKALGFYLHLIVVPTRLSVEPQFAAQQQWTWPLTASVLLAATVLAAAVWLWRSRQLRGLFLLAWGFLYLMPTSVVPLNVLVNERRIYVPVAVLCIACGLYLPSLLQRITWRPHTRWRQLLGVGSVGLLAILSVQRSHVWADARSLWEDAVRKAPAMSRPHLYLGNAHKDAAQHEGDRAARVVHWRAASAAYEAAHARAQDLDLSLRALNNRGGVHFAMGQDLAHLGRPPSEYTQEYARAEALWREAVDQNPLYADALINLGTTVLNQARRAGDPAESQRLLQESIDYFERALAVRPNHYQGHGNLGVAYEDLGDLDRAEARYRRATYLNPNDWMTLKNLANLLQRRAQADLQSGDVDAARTRLGIALELIRRALQLNAAVPKGREVLQAVKDGLLQVGSR